MELTTSLTILYISIHILTCKGNWCINNGGIIVLFIPTFGKPRMELFSLMVEQVNSSHSSFLISFFFFFFLLFLLVVFNFKKPGPAKYNFPPSPSKLPFIGNMHQLLHGSLHHTLHSLSQKHGPLMLLHLFSKPTLIVSSPEMAQAVMKTHDHVFSSRPELAIVKRLTYGKDITFSPYGEHWRQIRKICVLEVFSVKKVQSFRFVREEEVALLMDRIEAAPSGVNLSEMFYALTNSVICRAALGRKYGEEEEGGGMKFKRILNELQSLLGTSNMGDLVPSLGWVNNFNGLNARVEKNFREMDSFLDEVIEEHLAKKKTRSEGEEAEEDIVDIMLRNEEESTFAIPIARDTTKAIILDMFAAGTDTSAIVLEWAISELVKHPKIMEEAQKEVRNVAKGNRVLKETNIDQMPILKAIVKETLRLHPPAPLLIIRESMKDVEIESYHIPAKTTVIINAFVVGRDPVWWENSEKFWPRRFLNGSSNIVDFKGQDFQLIPFGSGRRGCPAILFATSVIELTIANLLNRFDWFMPNGVDGNELDMREGSGLSVPRKSDLILIGEPHYKILS